MGGAGRTALTQARTGSGAPEQQDALNSTMGEPAELAFQHQGYLFLALPTGLPVTRARNALRID